MRLDTLGRIAPALFVIFGFTVSHRVCRGDEPGDKAGKADAAPTKQGVERLQEEAAALKPLMKSGFTRKFLAGTADLPKIDERPLHVNPTMKQYYSARSFKKLSRDEQAATQERSVGETIYYTTKYGSPLAYAGVLEVLAKHGAGDLSGKRLMDYGYGTVGHLRLLASAGVDAVGVDVDPLLTAIYSEPQDQGVMKSTSGTDGRVTLVDGQWPGDPAVKKAVGGGYDVITSKNTLKNGFIHPERPVDKSRLVDLSVSDEAFVEALADALKPGGYVVIYNICPPQSPPDQEYIPWADGRCPFPRKMWEKAGFEVLAFDEDDHAAMRAMGMGLGWDDGKGAAELEKSYFAHYSLFRKK
ncbi:MAG TPA: hypothetical protein VNT79_03445 [Phycisphaerae bacterium]|nr:hypothetical protein [Phycisphaerae bacterium]